MSCIRLDVRIFERPSHLEGQTQPFQELQALPMDDPATLIHVPTTSVCRYLSIGWGVEPHLFSSAQSGTNELALPLSYTEPHKMDLRLPNMIQ